MNATRSRKTKKTIRVQKYHLCRWDGETLVKIASRQRFGAIWRLSQLNREVFIVTESVAIDPDASDLGTIYWFDDKGRNMDRYF